MRTVVLHTLEEQLPNVMERYGIDGIPEGVVVVGGNIDDLSNDPFGDDDEILSGTTIEETLSQPDDVRGRLREQLNRVHQELSRIRDVGDFPGRPESWVGKSVLPPSDCYAFYLPWHHFYANIWGIYLIVEGIEALANEIVFSSQSALSLSEARHAAKIFLFHHEAYHNAVETFSARLEVAHREPCYKAGFRGLYRSVRPLPEIHEEALANCYGAIKVRSFAFNSVQPNGRRKHLRLKAYDALLDIFSKQPAPYSDAVLALATRRDWESEFQERLHNACFLPRIGSLGPEIWKAFPHALHPSLKRNGEFSYLVHRSHPIVRNRAGVFYYDRRKFLQRLNAERPGQLVGGGKHPKWQTSDGRRIPIPTGDLARGTARSILKELGVIECYKTVDQFMQGGAA